VSGRIVGGGDLVVAFGDHFPTLDDAAYGLPPPAFIISSERSIVRLHKGGPLHPDAPLAGISRVSA